MTARDAARRLAELSLVVIAAFVPLSIVGEQIGGVLMAVSVLVAWWLGARSLVQKSLIVPVVAFAAVGLLSSLVSPVELPWRAWTADRPVFLLVLIPAVFALSRQPDALLKRVLLALLVGGAFVGLLGVIQTKTGFDLNHALHVRRTPLRVDAPNGRGFSAIGTFNSRLTFAAIEAGLLVLALGLAAGKVSARVRVAAILACLALGGGVAATWARASWFGVLLGVLVIAAGLGRRAPALLLGLTLAVGTLSLAVPSLRTRAVSALQTTANGDRLFIWSRATEVIADYPVQGVGVYGYPVVAAPYYDRHDPLFPMRTWAHDMPLTLLAETGIAGLMSWIWIFVAMAGVALSALRTSETPLVRAARLGALGAAGSLFVTSLFHDVLYDGEAAIALFFFAGLACARAPAEQDEPAAQPEPTSLLS